MFEYYCLTYLRGIQRSQQLSSKSAKAMGQPFILVSKRPLVRLHYREFTLLGMSPEQKISHYSNPVAIPVGEWKTWFTFYSAENFDAPLLPPHSSLSKVGGGLPRELHKLEFIFQMFHEARNTISRHFKIRSTVVQLMSRSMQFANSLSLKPWQPAFLHTNIKNRYAPYSKLRQH